MIHLYDKVNYGGIVIFDDFFVEGSGNKKFPGARRAVKEYLGESYEKIEQTILTNKHRYCSQQVFSCL